MGRGRPLGTHVGFFRSHRRSASLPADESRLNRSVMLLELGGEAQRANVIANQAAQDSDAIVNASRRHDRAFLHDVASKLANVNSMPSAPVEHHKNKTSVTIHSRPPRSPRSAVARSVPPAGAHRSALSPDENFEIASYLQRTPAVHTRRAASVPPAMPSSRPSVPRWFPTSSAYYGRRSGGHGVPAVPTGLPPTPSSVTYGSPSDAVVGVAHTSLYGDIVIGIPYKKRFMFNAQHDDALDTQSLPPVHINLPSRVSSAPAHSRYHAATAGASSAKNLTVGLPFTRASYAGPFTFSDVGPAHHHVTTSGSDVDDVISIKSYPGSAAAAAGRTGKRSAKSLDIEADIASSIFGDVNAVPVRPTTVNKDYKTIMARYVPSNGPKTITSLTDNELDRNMQPRMSPRTSIQSSTTHHREYSLPTMPPAAGPQKPKKPAMSDTRKKLRDLLCRSKGNPRYFDD